MLIGCEFDLVAIKPVCENKCSQDLFAIVHMCGYSFLISLQTSKGSGVLFLSSNGRLVNCLNSSGTP